MRLFFLLLLANLAASTSAHAGVVVSLWAPSVLVYDPYDPGFVPDPRPDYQWVPGVWDEYGYFVPGHWMPTQPNPGYYWAPGYWAGRTYYEGYWRPPPPVGRAWVDGYYVRGRYVHPRTVESHRVDTVRARGHERVRTHEQQPPEGHAPPPPRKKPTHKPAHKPDKH